MPDPDRIMYPADPAVIRRAVTRKFEAEVRIEVGGQLTRRMIRTAGALEREICEQAEDQVHYDLMAQCLVGYLADANELRHLYMVGDDDQWFTR